MNKDIFKINIKQFFSILGLIFLSSCLKQESKNRVLYNDFENYTDWNILLPTIKHGSAHSGNYFCKLDPSHTYSMGYSCGAGLLMAQHIRTIKVSGWVKLPCDNSKISIVCCIGKEGNSPIYWKAIRSDDEDIETEKWLELSGKFDIPLTLDPSSRLNIYFWCHGNEKVYGDDLRMEFIN